MSNTVINQQLVNQQQLEKDKKSIYMWVKLTNSTSVLFIMFLFKRHPLFPLLKLLLEKCEQATTNPELINHEDFNQELKSFIDQNEENLKPIETQNKVIDELIMKSIQVLRIHLLELGKVNELCKDFCQRYISCLKVKLNSDNIFKNELNYSVDGDDNNENFEDTIDNDTEENNLLSFHTSNKNYNNSSSVSDEILFEKKIENNSSLQSSPFNDNLVSLLNLFCIWYN